MQQATTSRLATANSLWPELTGDAAARVSDHQRAALATATARPFGLLTGTPGTGKTHTTGVLVAELLRKYGERAVAVCAPTGKAAVRLTSAMVRQGAAVTATTIHQLLEIGRNGHDGDGWGFQRNESNPLEQKFVIVDESSMLDTDLAADLLRACAPGTHCLWIGDPYQLPPVGHGAPLRDLIAAGIPNGHLTEIRRNAGMIVHACAAIKDGKSFEAVTERANVDPAAGRNLWHIEAAEPAQQIEQLISLYDGIKRAGRRDVLWDVQVLVATNKSGDLGRKAVNDRLQAELNAGGDRAEGNPFRVGDKIICLRNHWVIGSDPKRPLEVDRGTEHYLANGEIGQVIAVAPKITAARFGGPDRFVRIAMGKAAGGGDDAGAGASGGGADESAGRGCNYFDLAYGITGHKAQGSEWPIVVLLIDAAPGARYVCSREWLYTSLSRASALCVTIGRRGVMEQMARRPTLEKRKTFLKELLLAS